MAGSILVPTDGSAPSRRALARAVRFAKALKARIVGFHVAPPFTLPVYGEYVPPDLLSPREHDKMVRKVSQKYLAQVKRAADAARVSSTGAWVKSDYPQDAILAAARRYHCDMIVMGSHGRRGLERMLLGSVTQKVLAKSRIPVVVCR